MAEPAERAHVASLLPAPVQRGCSALLLLNGFTGHSCAVLPLHLCLSPSFFKIRCNVQKPLQKAEKGTWFTDG